MPAPVLVELLRRGDLTLVRSGTVGGVGLRRDVDGRPVGPASAFDADEWRWLLHCAAPVALRELAAIEAEAERARKAAAAEPEQATLAIDA